MFTAITVTRQKNGPGEEPLDLGFVAEALLFYDSVRVVGDHQVLRQLIVALGPDIFLEFLSGKHLQFTSLANSTAVVTTNSGSSMERHDFCLVGAPDQSVSRVLPRLIEDAIGRRGRARRLAQRIIPQIETIELDSAVPERGRQDLADQGYVQDAVATVLRAYVRDYRLPDPFRFVVHRDQAGLIVETNLDLAAANQAYHRHVPPEHSSLSKAYLLEHLLAAQKHCRLAAEYGSEIATDPVNSDVMRTKIRQVLAARDRSAEQIERFQEFIFDDSRSIQEAINDGSRSFQELLPLLERAVKFRGWLRDQEPDHDLVKSYFREVTRDSWIDRLPPKAGRWALFAGAGAAIDAMGAGGLGTGLGIALSAADNFLLDKLIKGWRPHHFVNRDLKEFVSGGAT